MGEPGAVAVTAARATEEEEDSMIRASVAMTGWATRWRGREGGGGGGGPGNASSADDADERRPRQRPAAAVIERAIGGLFFSRSSRGFSRVL